MLEEITLEKDLYLFELDDVLFPKRDYLVQVYYLFASFYEFSEGLDTKANEIAQFMAKVYDIHGEGQVFIATKTLFNIDDKYEENFNRLMANAQLPLKLELTQEKQLLLRKLHEKGTRIAILTKGNPVEQLNKVKFIEWGPLSFLKPSLKIFFVDELEYKLINPLAYIAEEYNLEIDQIVHITH